MLRLAILGAGAWGTALAIHFSKQAMVCLWSRNKSHVKDMARERRNQHYFPDLPFPPTMAVSNDVAEAIKEVAYIVVTTPISGLRETLGRLQDSTAPILWACKGLEPGSMLLAHEIAAELLTKKEIAAQGTLGGPCFALESAKGLPAAATVASMNRQFAIDTANMLSSPSLHLYASIDVTGVEVGGALKNIIAIGVGICDGLQLGLNARAALLTRGLAEIARFGMALGAKMETFLGLSGIGDLVLTTTGHLSRNRRVGLMLAQGKTLNVILEELGHVAEGVSCAREVERRARSLGVTMPITRFINQVLHQEAKLSREAILQALMEGAPTMEFNFPSQAKDAI